MTDRQTPIDVKIHKDHLHIAYVMLFHALEEVLTAVAEQQASEDWHRPLYERVQRRLDANNAALTKVAAQMDRDTLPAHLHDMPGAVRAGSATVDAAFDTALAKMRKRAERDPGR